MSLGSKRGRVGRNARARNVEVVDIQGDVEQIDVPRRLSGVVDVASTISRAMGSVVAFESSCTSRLLAAQLVVFLAQQRLRTARCEDVTAFTPIGLRRPR